MVEEPVGCVDCVEDGSSAKAVEDVDSSTVVDETILVGTGVKEGLGASKVVAGIKARLFEVEFAVKVLEAINEIP